MKTLSTCILLILPFLVQAQQKNLYTLLHEALQEADRGFPTFMKDTVRQANLIYLKEEVASQYAGVSRVYLSTEKNFSSQIMNNNLYTLHEMHIVGSNVGGGDKTWEQLKDTMFAWYKKNVDFLITRYDALLSHTDIIIRPEDQNSKLYPAFISYFYHKAIQLPSGLTDPIEIEKRLDVAPYFSIALRRPFMGKAYNLEFKVHGATKQ